MSLLAREAAEAADGARRQLAACAAPLAALGRRLRDRPPPVIATCARGSSDHAATYGKYLLETSLGRVVASVGPSLASMYHRRLEGLDGALVLCISQSGRSPDLLALAEAAHRRAALVVGLLNDDASPLATHCDVVLPLCAGPEHSIAATKSFLLAGVALLQLTAAWTDDPELREAVARTPDALDAAAALDWSPALTSLASARGLYVVGRGLSLGPAQELALKLKETCRLHAEAFSIAEVLHGPVALVGPGFPILALGQLDATAPSTCDALVRLASHGAAIHSALDAPGAQRLPTVEAPAVIAPLCQIQSAYLALDALAAARGVDPDAPPHLAKVTRTQ